MSGFGGDPGVVYFPVGGSDDVDIGSANTDLRHNLELLRLLAVQVPPPAQASPKDRGSEEDPDTKPQQPDPPRGPSS